MALNYGQIAQSGLRSSLAGLNVGMPLYNRQQQHQDQQVSSFNRWMDQFNQNKAPQPEWQRALSVLKQQQAPGYGSMQPQLNQIGQGAYPGQMSVPQQSALGGSPMMFNQPNYAFEQFFQGGGVPSESMMAPFMDNTEQSQMAGAQAPQELSGWKWYANKALQGVEGISPLVGAAATFYGGPLGSLAGGILGSGAQLGQQWLQG